MGQLGLGDWAEDSVTGVVGMITAITYYLGGSDRLMIEWLSGADGSPQEMWVERDRLNATAPRR